MSSFYLFAGLFHYIKWNPYFTVHVSLSPPSLLNSIDTIFSSFKQGKINLLTIKQLWLQSLDHRFPFRFFHIPWFHKTRKPPRLHDDLFHCSVLFFGKSNRSHIQKLSRAPVPLYSRTVPYFQRFTRPAADAGIPRTMSTTDRSTQT